MTRADDAMFRLPVAQPPTRKLHVAILVAPGFCVPDMIGIHTVFGVVPNSDVHLVWKNTDPMEGLPRFPTRATTDFAACPRDLDVLHVPALPFEAMEDEETLAFLADRGSRARWLTAVCGGVHMLGAAGLLRGYRATTNFHMHDQLAYFGATPTPGHVVEDRNRITAGPVSGAFDIGLRLLGRLSSEELAREVELHLEYAPEPPYRTGRPDLAGPELTARALKTLGGMTEAMREVSMRASRRLNLA